MADYWKSQPRKFCQYCKCWIADNKPSIDFHERGKNHKENVAAKFNDIRKKSVNKAKQEVKMSKQLAAMEEAAQRAYEQDLKRMELEASGIRLEAHSTALPEMLPQPLVGKAQPNRQLGQAQQQKQTNKKQKPGGPSFPSGPEAEFWVAGQRDGTTYYYNTMTGESRFNETKTKKSKKAAAQSEGTSSVWMEGLSPEGYTYYYNTQTGESSWEKPAELASKDTGTAPQSKDDKGTSEAAKEPGAGPEGQEPSTRKRKADDEDEESDGTSAREKGEAEEKEGEKAEEKREEEAVAPPKRRVNPYGAWEQVKVEPPKKEKFVDLQLPKVQVEVPPPPPDVPPEPKPKFKERVITSLGVEGGPVAFKKKQNGKARSLRQRDADD